MLCTAIELGQTNIGLTFKSVPEGLGAFCAWDFCTKRAKGFI